ncbi:MAG: hypothetical protein KJ072_18240 [Verrucomicrobia bacterium]|nr:hypothetical protein [Verrucomicrobiota bacterium]
MSIIATQYRHARRPAGDRTFRNGSTGLAMFAVNVILVLAALQVAAETLVVQDLPGDGTDISAGADGSIWLVGYDSTDKDRDLYRWTELGWERIAGDGFRIAVDPEGNPWVLEGDGDVKHLENGIWVEKPGRGTDIAVGANGEVWMVGWYNDLLDTDRNPENRDIYRWTGSAWEEVDGGAVRIAVAPDGTPWILNDDGRLRQRVNGEWVPVDGRATDLGIGSDGTVWVTTLTDDWGEDGKLARLEGTNWINQTRSSAAVTVDPTGMPWFTMGDGDVYRGLGYEGRLSTPVVQPGQVELSFFTATGASYLVQVRRDLGLPWTELQRVTGNGSLMTVTDTPPAEARTSFYGVLIE